MREETIITENLVEQLAQAQREAAYYQNLARECGERRLKEAEDLSCLIQKLRQTEKELAHSRDELEQRVQERTSELQATTMHLELLRAAMNEMSAVLDITTLIHVILEQAIKLAGATCGQLALYEPQTRHLRITLSLNLMQDTLCVCQALDIDTLGLVAHRHQPLIFNDYASCPVHTHTGKTCLLKAVMLVPLLAGNECIGVIGIGSSHPGQRFKSTDEQLLCLFAQQATIVLQNARLFTEIQKLATIDPLTGLYNRRLFFDLAEKEIERTRRSGDAVSVIMLDIDNFKRINDTYGHLIGDEVLRGVTAQCRASMRMHDISGRYGGEEIVVLLPQTGAEDARQIAERLRLLIAQTYIPCERGNLSVTVSMGVAASYVSNGLKLAHLIHQADQALYQAKLSGRNRVCVWGEVLA